ncbi:MAG: aldose 1-epimerase [Ruminococcus sp.]|jgi:aldose 1-epimerase|nr:aldose 1-epimerase [Ruminococcus sp.]
MASMALAEITEFKGTEAVKLSVGEAFAVISPSLGANVVRFCDKQRQIEVFRYSEKVSYGEMDKARELWGVPLLYLANRFADGVIKTSDAVYQLPINEPAAHNFIHGFVHKRAYKIRQMGTVPETDTAFCETEFIYDKSDEFYKYFPVDFELILRCELSMYHGLPCLKHMIHLTNLSPKKLPVSLCTHTAINAPFIKGGKQEDVRLLIPIAEKIDMEKTRWLPTEKPKLPLDDYDLQYKNGEMIPVLKDINNDMYTLMQDEKDSHGNKISKVIIKDTESGHEIINVLGQAYKFEIVWNNSGDKNYFCPEPMTAQINAPNMNIPRTESGYEEISAGESFTAVQKFLIK